MIITVYDSESRFIGMRTGSESLRKSNFEKLISIAEDVGVAASRGVVKHEISSPDERKYLTPPTRCDIVGYAIYLLPIGHFAEFLHFVGYPIFITKFIYKEVVYVFDN